MLIAMRKKIRYPAENMKLEDDRHIWVDGQVWMCGRDSNDWMT